MTLSEIVPCSTCGKEVRRRGLPGHERFVHGAVAARSGDATEEAVPKTTRNSYSCSEDGCDNEFDTEERWAVHGLGHKVDALGGQLLEQLQGTVQEAVRGVADKVIGPLREHVDARLAEFNPVHAHLGEVMQYAGECPSCKPIMESLKADMRDQASRELTVASRSNSRVTAAQPAATNPTKETPQPRKFTGDLDILTLDAYRLDAVESDGGVLLKVRDEELAKEAIEGGVVPSTCVVAVGPDGRTKYLCEPVQD